MKGVGLVGILLALLIVGMLYMKKSNEVSDKATKSAKVTAQEMGMDPGKIKNVQDISKQIDADLQRKVREVEERNKKLLEGI